MILIFTESFTWKPFELAYRPGRPEHCNVLLYFFVSYYTIGRNKNLRTVLFTCTFLAVGLLDALHTLTYNGMPGFFAEASVAVATSFWVAARLTAAIGMLAAGFIKHNYTVKQHRFIFVAASLVYSIVVSYVLLYKQEHLPPLFVEGVGLCCLWLS